MYGKQHSFFRKKTYGDLRRGDTFKARGKIWKVVGKDEYPIGIKGCWAYIVDLTESKIK